LKLLLITSGLGPGGKERQLIELLKSLIKNGVETGLITYNTNQHYSDTAKKHSSYFRELTKRPTRLEPFFSTWKCIRDFRPDIIHTWDYLSTLYSLLPARHYKIPLVNGSIRDSGTEKGLEFHLKRFLLLKSDHVIANSQSGLKAYRCEGSVIYNSISSNRFIVPCTSEDFNLVMTANFSRYKDHTTFFKAAVQLLEEKVIDNAYLVGGGPDLLHWQQYIHEKYSVFENQIHFTGTIAHVEEFLSKCKIGILCSTSEYSEGLSNAVLEYMAAGLVPVATETGGNPEMIEHGKNGFLIAPRDHEALVEVVKTLKSDQGRFEAVSLSAKQTIGGKFDATANFSKQMQFYQSILKP
jgi:glycosyltransferase involved in cell wall biosynthesis